MFGRGDQQDPVDRSGDDGRPGIQIGEVESGIAKFDRGTPEDGKQVPIADVERLIGELGEQ